MTRDAHHHVKVLTVHRIDLGPHVAWEFLVLEWGPTYSRGTCASAYALRETEDDNSVFVGTEEILPSVLDDPDHPRRHLYMAVMMFIGMGVTESTTDDLEALWAKTY